ncbi:MAG: alpha/beta hydrolase [Pyrinomonadaceae bacterium]
MPILTLTETDIAYEVRGSGEPLVLIPGFASGAWSWEWQAEALSAQFHIVTFDPRGVSRSALHDDAHVSITKIAGDIAALLRELRLDRAHILGISFGGFVAQEFALRYPDRVNKLVLASTSFGGPNHVMPPMEVLAAFSSTEGLNDSDRVRKHLTTAFTPEFVLDHAGEVDRFCTLREENCVPDEVYQQQLASALAFNTEGRVGEINAETLVLTGDGDTVVPAENSRNLANKIPNATLGVISDGGHMAFVENAEEFNSFVIEFLNGSY